MPVVIDPAQFSADVFNRMFAGFCQGMQQMKKCTYKGWFAIAAAALVFPVAAQAQYQVGNDGRALDANPQVGSGGYNGEGPANPYQVIPGNAVVDGNVTNNQQFRGRVPYSDPLEFRGSTAGAGADRFIARSSGVPEAYTAPVNPFATTTFLGDARGVNPPPGYTQQGSTGAFTPSIQQEPISGDRRVGSVSGVPIQYLGQNGNFILSGPVDNATQTQSFLEASPNYGVRQTTGRFSDGLPRPGQLSPTVARMQAELRSSLQTQTAINPTAVNDGNLATANAQPFDAPQNQALNTQQNNLAANQQQPLTSGISDTRADLPAPEQQSSQYAELSKRLDQYQSLRMAREARETRAANNQANQQPGDAQQPGAVRPGQPAGVAQQPVTPQPGAQPESLRTPMVPKENPNPRIIPESERPAEPLQIKSLADGVAAKGLQQTLADAEQKMQQGSYLSALDSYQLAQTVAPNNPLVQLGKANALLGASYFARAEAELRAAFTADPALLLAQYDLGTMIGQKRIDNLVRDLKLIARTETSQPQAVFLLSYIMYNTNHPELAQEYLTMAEQRSGGTGKDSVYALMREYWKLPPAPENNK